MADNRLPVIADYRPTRRFAWRHGKPVSQAEALAAIRSLARELQDGGPCINLCEDRYLFTLAFAAVCLCGGVNLLPQSRAEGVLNDLREDYPGARILDDGRIAEAIGTSSTRQAPTEAPGIDGGHLAAIAFTSGSTGRPSPQPKYWRDLQTGTGLCRRRFFPERQELNIVATVPPQHMYGLETSVLTVLQAGLAAHASRPFMPWDITRALAEMTRPRLLVTTPVHLRACLEADIEMPAIDLVISATAPLSRDLAWAAERSWHTEVHEIYGCTEAGSLASRRTTQDSTWTLYDGMRLERQEDDGTPCLYGPQLRQPAPLSDDLELLDDRHFRLLGRSADMIKLAGKRMSLSDLNQQLLAIEGVHDAVAFLPGENNGQQRPAALVVAPQLEPREIAARLSTRIDPVFVPRPLVRVAQLPRNAVGKLPRAELESLIPVVAGTREDLAGMKTERFTVPADHPCLPGHFPQRPVVPAVVILEAVIAAAGRRYGKRVATLMRCKFLRPLAPETVCEISLEDDGGNRIRFRCTSGGAPLAEGRLELETVRDE